MSKSFILNSSTKVSFNGKKTIPIENAINILIRDMDKVFESRECSDRDKKNNEIIIDYLPEYEDNDLLPETFFIKFEISEDKKDILRVIAKDELGIIYGILYISEKYLGVEPFWFWNHKEPEKKEFALIPMADYMSPPHRVKFRGWFVNDEVLLTGWKGDPLSEEVWKPVFEALLRCGGNMIIPGTDNTSRLNRKAASEMGLWITHHHAEPLGAEMFLRVYPDKEPRYDVNHELFKKLWRDSVIEQKDMNVIWNVGFRGQGDYAFWDFDPSYKTPEARGKLISKIIQIQCDIVREYVENPVFCTNLYGEIMELYREGYIELPEGVIKIWADTGYGKMVSRRQHNHNPRIYALPYPKDKGPHGIYYHVTFYDLQASNHLVMLPNTPEFVNNELKASFDSGAEEFMIVNSGNIRPHTYMLDLISKIWSNGPIDTESHLKSYTESFFSSASESVQQCIKKFFKASIQYGIYDDERAGEQFYHHPARIIMCHWIDGDHDEYENLLYWATGDVSFEEQIKWYKEKCKEGLEGWESLKEECLNVLTLLNEKEKTLFSDSILLQTILHSSGCRGAIKLCKGYEAYKSKAYALAFMYISDTIKDYEEGLNAMRNAEHDRWVDFYKNDCLTNVKLTIYCLDTLRRYIRVLGDKPNFFAWERQYLFPETERNIFAESAYYNQLSDDELYERLRDRIKRNL